MLWFCNFHRMVSCLHVDFECVKLALWLTWRQNFMNSWSFLTHPGDKHDKEISNNCSLTPSSWFCRESHDLFNSSLNKTPNLMVFREISFWNKIFLCWINTEMFTVAELQLILTMYVNAENCKLYSAVCSFARHLILLRQPYVFQRNELKYCFYRQNPAYFPWIYLSILYKESLPASNRVHWQNFMGKNVQHS